ncbi:MAG: hypothetical protein EOP48_19365 [Sphingobacteriales bacterium]|nr:MAG: hypothetical protein EOP48_19365 [Sphingobacteriales bacterium]
MKKVIKYTIISIIILVAAYLFLGYFSSYVGWYGYEKWKYRVGSVDIAEAKQRGVFVKDLHFSVEGYSGDLYGFTPFISKGYRYGYHTSKETIALTDSKFPYDLSFQYKRNQKFGVLILKSELNKFDSSDSVWGYMEKPFLPDTIVLEIGGENIPKNARIKVW